MAPINDEDVQMTTIHSAPAPDGATLAATISKPNDDNDNAPVDNRERSSLRVFFILLALYIALFIAALDITIISTAIPTISATLHSASGYIWVGAAYSIANAAAGPIWAKLSDIWGRKIVFLVAIAIFGGSSAMCGAANSMEVLIAGRSLQGAAGGGLILLVNIAISDLFSVRERSLYLGMCEGVWSVAGGLGPILGGVLTELVSWRWCFYINLPFVAVAFVLILVFLDVHNPRTGVVEGLKAIDWAGSVTMLGFTLMVLLGLDFGGSIFPWKSATVICLIVFGSLLSLVFIWSEKHIAEYPLIPMRIFKSRSNVACLAVTMIHGFVFLAAEYYLPLYFQSSLALSPLHSGLLSFPVVISAALTGILVGLFIHRTGRYREPIWLGTFLITLGNGLFIDLSATSSHTKIIFYQIIEGCGAGCLFEPPLIALQAAVPQSETATATSTLSFLRGLALALSVVVGGVVFQNSMSTRSASLTAAGLPSNLTDLLTGANAAAHVGIVHELPGKPEQLFAVKEAFAWSMRNMWIMFASVGLVGFLVSFFVDEAHLRLEHEETVTGLKKRVVDGGKGVVNELELEGGISRRRRESEREMT